MRRWQGEGRWAAYPLTERLDGYADYRRMVRHRLLPLVW